MRLNLRRIGIFFFLIAVSIGVGFSFDAIATALEKHRYPMEETVAADIRSNAQEFGIPEHILWGFVSAQSDFSSNKVSGDGSIGLMQLTPDEYSMINETILKEDAKDTELLYAPLPNLRAGSAYLSYLFHRYGVWETAFAAYEVGTDTVDAWLLDEALLSENGTLATIPDKQAAALAAQASTAADYYKRLYFESR